MNFLQTLTTKDGEHGQGFHYKTVNSDVLGWLIARATGQTVSDLLSERLWSQLGAEGDAYLLIDTQGTEFAGGGFNATLRDMARFGEMMRLDGCFNGRQIIPKAVVDDIRWGRQYGGICPRRRLPLAGRFCLPQYVVGEP